MLPKNNRNLISQTLATALSFGLFVYFFFPLIFGDMGYFAMRRLDQKLSEAQIKYDHLLTENTRLENRAKIFRHEIGPDLLDIQAHAVLNFAKPDEYEILEK